MAAKGALILLTAGGAVVVYKALEEVPSDTVADDVDGRLTGPHIYPVLIGPALKHGLPYLRDRYFKRANEPLQVPNTADDHRGPGPRNRRRH
ncbi:hypothetical protein ACFY0F_38305 [Streptomyces sp. NPDC001544]|uniref:hypothetical protein n=1 Tax=Streptomyces sp. NPDC001544 TaxID=3364584 RepID=UPI0036BCDE66